MSTRVTSRLGGTLARTFAATALTIAGLGSAQAAIVWNSMGTLATGFLANGAAAHTNAQTFQLSQATNLTDFAWKGAYVDNLPGATEAFTIDIYSSVAGTPSNAPLATLGAGAANRSATGTLLLNTFDIYDYSFAPVAGLSLGAGDYFFSVNSNGGNWYWGVTSTSDGSFFVRDNLGPWQGGTATLAFRVDGTALPEPGSLALVGISLAGLLFARRRTS